MTKISKIKRSSVQALKVGKTISKILWQSTADPEESIGDISARLGLDDWRKAIVETKNSLAQKNLPILAAGVAYYSTLAFFPLTVAAVAIGALLITPEQVENLIGATKVYLPDEIAGLVSRQLEALVVNRNANLLAAILAIVLALFSASGASKNLIVAINAAYDVKESRSWLKRQALGLIWTLGGIVFGFIVLALLVLNQKILGGLEPGVESVKWLLFGRWPVIFALTILGLSAFYRYGPNRSLSRWQWATRGAAAATIIWFITTLAFFAYVQNFSNFAKQYSLFAGIIALMIWFNLSALIVLLGAELNHSLEKIVRRKS